MDKAKKIQVVSDKTLVDQEDHNRQAMLSYIPVINNLLGSPKVAPTFILDLYFLILAMNRLLLEKMPPMTGHELVYFFREDIGQYLELCLNKFKVVF